MLEKVLSNKKPPASEVEANQTQEATADTQPAVNADSPASTPQVQTITETPAVGEGKPKDITQLKVEKSCSRGMGSWLASHSISLAITSYQTGRVYLVGSDPNGRVSFFERIFERAMGIVGNSQRIFLGGLYQLWRFENV